VVCGAQRFVGDQQDALANPTVLVEVLSDSTEAYDRGKKFEQYRQIESLRAYLLVSQNEPRIEQFVRGESGQWELREAAGLDGALELAPLQIKLALAEVFAGVKFVPVPIRPRITPASP